MSGRSRIATLALALVALLPAGTAGQERVRLGGRGTYETDTILRRVLREPRLTVIAHDTTLNPADTLQGPVLFAGNTVRFNGTIDGELIIVNANVFVRAQALITGDVINIGGGFFRADDAGIDGALREYRDALYRVEPTEDGVRLVGAVRPSLVDLDLLWGVHVPEYDRVNGVTLAWGGTWLTPRLGQLEPEIRFRANYHTAREKPGGLVEFGLRGATTFGAVGAERAVYTNDGWMRNDVLNSFSFLTRGRDYRDYYEADRVWGRLERGWGPEDGELRAAVSLQSEVARSLGTIDPWTIFDHDSVRPNPRIDEGRSNSVIASLTGHWERPSIAANARLLVETAGGALGGDFDFARFEITGDAAMNAFANHSLLVEWQLRSPWPGTDSLPRQRWNVLGGRGTLYTFDPAEFRGDRLVYVESEYLVPLPAALTLRGLGRPAIGFVHRAGMAWSHDVDRDLVQNLGLRLRFRLAWLLAIVDPDDTDNTGLFFGVALPMRYPWWPDER